jgi:hypothetical protein
MKRFGVMIDMSRNAVMKVSQVKNYIKIVKDFGYNMIMLYTEDTYEVENEPYFGYLRGKYTIAELKEIVAYCDELEMEIIPCIQTLAHLETISGHVRLCRPLFCGHDAWQGRRFSGVR